MRSLLNLDILRVHAALIVVSLIYGYFYVAVKLLLLEISPGEFILLRFVLTALIVLAIEALWHKKKPPQGRDFWEIVLLGLLGVFLVQILVVWGLSLTTAFHSALIMATIPIQTLLFSIITSRERFQPHKLLGILIGFVGVSILFFFSKNPETPLPETYLQGDLIVLLNAMAFSWFLLGSQKILKKYNSFSFMAYCYIVSALAYGLVFWGEHTITGGVVGLAFLEQLNLTTWSLIAYVVLFASIGTYTLNNYALRRVNPSIVAVYIFIQPLISALTGFYFLGEPFNLPMAIATLITFLGVLLASKSDGKTPVHSPSSLENSG